MSRILTWITFITLFAGVISTTQAKGPPGGVGGKGAPDIGADIETPEDPAMDVKKDVDRKMKAADKKMKEAEEKAEREMEEKKEDVKGLEKQKEKKADQVQKELDKGSEKGKAMREEHRRKWWKFWESEEKTDSSAD